jgi:hypothetical protein
MLTHQLLTQELSRLSAAFNKTLTDEQFAVYWDSLKNLDNNLLKSAVALCIQKNKYFPVVSEIISNYKIIKDDFFRDNPVKIEYKPQEEFKISGKTMPEMCRKVLVDYESGVITKDQFEQDLIGLERKLMDVGKLGPIEFEKCVQRIKDISKK